MAKKDKTEKLKIIKNDDQLSYKDDLQNTQNIDIYDSSYNMKDIKRGAKKPDSKIRQFLINFIARLTQTDIMTKGSYLAYHIILSFIPMLVFISQMLSYVIDSFDDILFEAIAVLPDNAEMILRPVLDGIMSIRSTTVSSLSIISWIWLGSKGFVSLINTINKSLGLKDKKNFIVQRIVAIFYMLAFLILLAALLLFSVFNEAILGLITKFVPLDRTMPWLFNMLKHGIGYITPYLIMIMIFTFFYKLAPATTRKNRIPFSTALLASIFATVSIKLVTTIYSYIMNNISKLNIYYGSLAGIMALLVWLLMVCQIIIIGAEIIASILEVWNKNTLKNKE